MLKYVLAALVSVALAGAIPLNAAQAQMAPQQQDAKAKAKADAAPHCLTKHRHRPEKNLTALSRRVCRAKPGVDSEHCRTISAALAERKV